MDKSCLALWEESCKHLSRKLSTDVFNRWIAVIRPLSYTDDRLVLSVANDFYVCWLEENYLPLIRSAAQVVTGRDTEIVLQVDQKLASAPAAKSAAPAEAAKAPRKSTRFVSPLNPKLTFGSFVVGSSNNFAHAASMAVAQSLAKAYNPLLIYGGAGLGKTHLMQAIGNHVAATVKNAQVCYLSAEAFLNEYIDALQGGKIPAFRKKYRTTDLLLIDDIHFLAGKDRIQEEFFHTFNALHDAHKQIVLSSDRPPSDVQGLEPRLVSRFEWGVSTQIEPPDLETRVAILKKKMETFLVALPDPVLFFIAEHIRSNIRRMEGALKSVAAYASLSGKPLTEETMESLLRDTLDRSAAAAPTVDVIQKAVAEHFDLRLADMTSKRRPQSIALPRQVAMYLCRTLTSQSLPSIGDSFGRNHATVIHACRQVTDRMRNDPSFRQSVHLIRHRLGAD